MVQFVFYVDGVRDEHDEQCVVDRAREALGTDQVSISSLTSALTVRMPDEAADDAFLRLAEALEEQGYTLKLPPNRLELTDATDTETVVPPEYENASTRRHRIPLSVFVSSLCALLIVAVLATYTVASELFDRRLADIQHGVWNDGASEDATLPTDQSAFAELELLQYLFDRYAIEDIDDEALMTAVLKAYAANTGDIYAEYYTAEELEALNADNQGEMEGIGVSVVNDKAEINGFSYSVLTIISVYEDTPALRAGLRIGDCIYTVIDPDGETYTVDALGYDTAISYIRGKAGSEAKFSVLRFDADGNYEIVPFTITREPIVSESVKGRVFESDPSIGIIKISQFDLTTPTQFHSAMDSLIAQGCTKFVFDVRYNPGGALYSIEAVLSTFLREGDVMISTVYKDGSEEFDRVRVADYSTFEGYEGCSVTREDIGKYRGYEFAVLINEYTASAAELFTSNLRDYDLATLVGVTTFGKGCMQTTFDLSYFGVEGALRLTTAWYQPPSGENYHDVGIAPDIEIAMDAAVIEQYGNIYLIPDQHDPQLMAAIDALS